jgi:hypothetical protein
MVFFWTSAVLAGIGTEPTIELAKAISLKTENGVIVNELLRTKETDIWPRETWPYSTTPALGNACASSMKITSDERRLAKPICTLKHSPTGSSRVRAVLLWTVWEQVETARKLIVAPGPFNPENLKGRLPA